MCGCLSHAPLWVPSPQLRHVPWLRIKPATFWFAGRHSIHWATPARALPYFFLVPLLFLLVFFLLPLLWGLTVPDSCSCIFPSQLLPSLPHPHLLLRVAYQSPQCLAPTAQHPTGIKQPGEVVNLCFSSVFKSSTEGGPLMGAWFYGIWRQRDGWCDLGWALPDQGT